MAKSEPAKPPIPPRFLELVPSARNPLEKFRLYETRARFYLIGCDREKRCFKVLKIDRSERADLNISEDPVVYSQVEVTSLLQRVAEGNRSTGGLTFVTKAYGIAGCIRFLECYYIILVTKRRQIGSICGQAIYCIIESQMITVPHSSILTDASYSKTELRYKKLLSSVDLTKDFFFSYTYPIMESLQRNVNAMRREQMPYENMFVWNSYLTQEIHMKCHNALWTIALVHGHYKQVKLSIFGRQFSVVLISRRSRHFAGTRFLKRGVNDKGKVANDVETEQIILDEDAGTYKGRMSSVVQMRGSIPLFWSQEASRFSPKPDIILQRYDPTYQATKLHFEDLANRYGNPIIVLNLIKNFEKRPREMILRREFASAVGYLNQIFPEESQLKFIHWDYNKFAKSKSANVLAVLGAVAREALDLTGFYYSRKCKLDKRTSTKLARASTGRDTSFGDVRGSSGDLVKMASTVESMNSAFPRDNSDALYQKKGNNDSQSHFQSGVLRTNCIDCLDRTNVAQYAYGLEALGRQLHTMGYTDDPKLDPECSIASALMEMYSSMGDALAQQYGGSAAHNTIFSERQGKWKATTHSREFLKSIKRYYSNAYTDGEKQDAINLFLGYFSPREGKPALWELDSDYFLHVFGICDDPVPNMDKSLVVSTTEKEASSCILSPIPACKEDFKRLKLTSFDKLIEKTCSSIRNVRLCVEPDMKANGSFGNTGMAPDAAEIQLKSPNWLFGQRKHEETLNSVKFGTNEDAKGRDQDDFCNFCFVDIERLCSVTDTSEEDVFQRYLSTSLIHAAEDWYGGILIFDHNENSKAYKHYAELSQAPLMATLETDLEAEDCYAAALHSVLKSNVSSEEDVQACMEAALQEYDRIGSDLGIHHSCAALAEDSSQLTRWMVGVDKMPKSGKR